MCEAQLTPQCWRISSSHRGCSIARLATAHGIERRLHRSECLFYLFRAKSGTGNGRVVQHQAQRGGSTAQAHSAHLTKWRAVFKANDGAIVERRLALARLLGSNQADEVMHLSTSVSRNFRTYLHHDGGSDYGKYSASGADFLRLLDRRQRRPRRLQRGA